MKIQNMDSNNLSPLYNKAIWEQQADKKEKNVNDTIGKAAEVYISSKGKMLSDAENDPLSMMSSKNFMTDADKRLADLKAKANEKEEYKKQAKELQEQLDENTDTLTDDERDDMTKKIADLREKGMTDEEKMYDLYDKRRALQKEVKENGDNYLEDEAAYMQNQIQSLEQQIDYYNNPIYGKFVTDGLNKISLERAVLDEQANISISKNRAKIQNATLDARSSEEAMSLLTPEQLEKRAAESSKPQPTAADVVATAVKESQDQAENTGDLGASASSLNFAADTSATSTNTKADKENDDDLDSETSKLLRTKEVKPDKKYSIIKS